MMRLPLRAVALGLATLVASGCGSSELRGLRRDIQRSAPEMRVEDGMNLSFGPMTIGLARTIVSIAGDDEDVQMARAALRNLRRVQFAQYELSGEFDPGTVAFPARLSRYVEQGWMPAVVVRDESEVVWILFNETDDRVDEALLVTLTPEELVMAKVRGDLTEIARIALAQARQELDDAEEIG